MYKLIERIKKELTEKEEVVIRTLDIVEEFDVAISTAYEILIRLKKPILQTFGNSVKVERVPGALIVQKVKSDENVKNELDKEKEKIDEYKKALGL